MDPRISKLIAKAKSGGYPDFGDLRRDEIRVALEMLTGRKVPKSTKRPDLMYQVQVVADGNRKIGDGVRDTLSAVSQKSMGSISPAAIHLVEDLGLVDKSPVHGLVLTPSGRAVLRHPPTDDYVIIDDSMTHAHPHHRGPLSVLRPIFMEMKAVNRKTAEKWNLRVEPFLPTAHD